MKERKQIFELLPIFINKKAKNKELILLYKSIRKELYKRGVFK